MADVIAIWACLLEAASESEDRGNPGVPDFESMDFALGLEEGVAERVYGLMRDRALIAKETGRLAAWERRQPKREREDDRGTERKRRQRERETVKAVAGGDASPNHRGLPTVAPTAEGENGAEKTVSSPRQAGGSTDGEARTSTKAGAVCKAILAKGVTDVNPSHPTLRALVDKGVAVDVFEQAAEVCTKASPPKGMAYLLSIVTRQLREAEGIDEGPGMPVAAWDQTRTSIEAKAEELGIGRWNEADLSATREQWHTYLARVRAAVAREASHA
ncbi:hypothetical protein [Variovorax gossypii]|nr:hypothetical protein [Variovorax gossypii]